MAMVSWHWKTRELLAMASIWAAHDRRGSAPGDAIGSQSVHFPDGRKAVFLCGVVHDVADVLHAGSAVCAGARLHQLFVDPRPLPSSVTAAAPGHRRSYHYKMQPKSVTVTCRAGSAVNR